MEQFFVFDGQHRRSRLPKNSDNLDAFRQRLTQQRAERHKDRVRLDAACTLQRFWRKTFAKIRVKARLRNVFDSTQFTSASDLSHQLRRIKMFYNIAEHSDTERLMRLCEMLLQRTNKQSINDVEQRLMPSFLSICLQLPAMPLLSDLKSTPPTVMATELYRLLVEPLTNTNNVDVVLRHHIYTCFVQFIFYQPSTPLLHCVLLPALAESCDQGQVDVDAVLDGLLIHEWPSFLERSLDDDVTHILKHQPADSTPTLPYALLSIAIGAKKIEVWSPATRLKFLCVIGASIEWLVAQCNTKDTHDTGDESMEVDTVDDNDDDHGLSTAQSSDAKPSKFDVCEPPNDCLPGSDAFAQWHSVRILHSSIVCPLLCETALADGGGHNNNMVAARFLPPIGHTLIRLNAYKRAQFIYRLSFNRDFVAYLWSFIVNSRKSVILGQSLLLEMLERGQPLSDVDKHRLLPSLALFCVLMTNTLVPLHDDEFWSVKGGQPKHSLMPFSNEQLRTISQHMRDVALSLVDLAYPDTGASGLFNRPTAVAKPNQTDVEQWNQLFEAVVELLSRLHKLDCRLQFCPTGFWSRHNRHVMANRHSFASASRYHRGATQPPMFTYVRWLTHDDVVERGGVLPTAAELRSVAILRRIPFVVPFHDRVTILHQLIAQDNADFGRDEHGWVHPHSSHSIHIRVRRNFLYEDAFEKLSLTNEPCLKKPIRVSMTNWTGAHEAGIDGGGIFREFLNELLKEGFDPSRGFFATTAHDRLLYPNPVSVSLNPHDFRDHYYFLGRMLGKLIYEQQLTELHFASFFLAKLQRSHSDSVDMHQLQSLDPVLYRTLSSLKSEPDIDSLDLDFSILVERLGFVECVELKPNGKQTRVTSANRLEYIHLVADFYLNRQIRPMVSAFRAGLANVLDMDWLAMFDHNEMQTLVSGVDADVDLTDMRTHTAYTGLKQ